MVNGESVGVMARWAEAHDALFVTFSTDYVFDGVGTRPYVESDPTDPVNAYGRSKLAGELATVDAGGRSLIVRTSWVISGTHPNFVATMLRLARERELRVVDDQRGCPTVVDDLAAATLRAIEAEATGHLHLTNQGDTTWFELARTAVELAGIHGRIDPCPTSEYPTPATRPAYSVLGSERVEALGIEPLAHWRESLPGVVARLTA